MTTCPDCDRRPLSYNECATCGNSGKVPTGREYLDAIRRIPGNRLLTGAEALAWIERQLDPRPR